MGVGVGVGVGVPPKNSRLVWGKSESEMLVFWFFVLLSSLISLAALLPCAERAPSWDRCFLSCPVLLECRPVMRIQMQMTTS